MTKAVGFDLDNTLYDQAQHVFPFFSVVAARIAEETDLEPKVLESTFREAWHELGPSHPKLFNVVLDRHGILNAQRVGTLVRMYHDHVGSLDAYPGVHPLLARLCRRFALFLITDGNAAMQRQKIERLGIGPLLRVVVLSAEHGRGAPKPDPAPFLSALQQLRCSPGDCLFAGDNPERDINGAARAGMRTVRVLTGPFSGAATAGIEPDFVIDSVTDIERVL